MFLTEAQVQLQFVLITLIAYCVIMANVSELESMGNGTDKYRLYGKCIFCVFVTVAQVQTAVFSFIC